MSNNAEELRKQRRAIVKKNNISKKQKDPFILWTTIASIAILLLVVAVVVFFTTKEAKESDVPAATVTPTGVIYDGAEFINEGDALIPNPANKSYDFEDVTFTAGEGINAEKNALTIYADYSCSHCADWEKSNFETVEENLNNGTLDSFTVAPVAFLGPYSLIGGNALLCTVEHSPEDALKVHNKLYDFATLMPASKKLPTLLTEAGFTITPEQSTCIKGEKYNNFIESSTLRAVDGPLPFLPEHAKVEGTPTVILNGAKLNINPSDSAALNEVIVDGKV